MTVKKLHPVAELAAYKTGSLTSSAAEDQKERYIRLAAEFDNFKKRAARQYADIIRNANEELILELLGILDDFQRALESANADDDRQMEERGNFLAGMKLIHENLLATLRKKGVTPMEALGKQFDPVYHEAVMQSPSDEDEGTVIGIVSPGYLINDKIIRHARVVVASPKNK
jgi:molecular chaperone GrpE